MSAFRCGLKFGAIVLCLCISACGGGGSASTGSRSGSAGSGSVVSGISFSLSPHQVSVSAFAADSSAPTATVQITVTDAPISQLYADYSSTKNGIASVTFRSVSHAVADMDIQFKSPDQLAAGVHNDTLTVSVCLDSSCVNKVSNGPQTISIEYTVEPNPVPSLSSINPNSATPGTGKLTLTVKGAAFMPGATVDWNGNARTTTYVSSSQLTAEILALDVGAAGTSTVTVSNPSPGGGASNSLVFSVQYGKPALDNLFPNAVVTGGQGFTLTIVGGGFGPGSQVQWNGSARSTQFVSDTELTTQISANDISSVGTANVTVLNPPPGGSSEPATFTIKPVTSDAVAFQIDADHSGVMNFGTVSFPSQPAWTVDVSGPPSYALIADGKVFVTAQVNGSAQLIALDQATGALAWGPIVLSDAANAAYDAGSVFVLSSPFGQPAFMQAYNATTGQQEWSTQLSGQYGFSSGPTAVDGFVYTGGAGSGGTLYAVNETDGTIAWTQPVENGDDSTPAVTADGVYVTYACQSYDFRPGTGERVWNYDTGCEGGGGATPVVANSVLYAAIGSPQSFGAPYDAEDAETGTLLGSYPADNPPAIAKNNGYFLQNGILVDIALSDNTTVWSFDGDGSLVTSPIVVNQYVIVGASSGNLYALDRTSGQQVWKVNVGAAIPPGASSGTSIPLTGLSAGHGLLVVPAGNSVIAYRLASN